MSKVDVHNEWDPLEEVIVGRATNARIPVADRGLFAIDYRHCGTPAAIPSGPYSPKIIEETEEDLAVLVATLERLGVVVRRPEVAASEVKFRSPDWESDGQYNYCPRDALLALGDTIIETPMVFRARFFETIAYKPLLLEYLLSGARWLSAPKPRLHDETYVLDRVPQGGETVHALADLEPVFDAANVLRLGRDLLYLVSDSGNRLGARWLQALLGDRYRVHVCEDIYSGVHLDSTLALIRPGLVVANGERVTRDNLPAALGGWDVVFFHEVVDVHAGGSHALSSKWIGMNLLMVNPHLAIVDRHQLPLIRTLEQHKVDVIPLELRHGRTLGGGFHCVTLDIRRRGALEDYAR